jgi:ATP-dependent Clp protease ATP-binding subunit ClpA
MFARFDESARLTVAMAGEEARVLGHAAIGGEHLALGIARAAPSPFSLELDSVREQVIAMFGRGQTRANAQLPFTATATKALEEAADEAFRRRHDTVRPAHVLLALLRVDERTRSLFEAMGRPIDDLTELAEAAFQATSAATDVHQTSGEGTEAVVLVAGIPIGDLGNPRTDGRVLRAMLEAGGPGARLLRDHGVDEDATRRLTGEG